MSVYWHQLLSCLLPSYKSYGLIPYMRTFYHFKHNIPPEFNLARYSKENLITSGVLLNMQFVI